MGGQCTLGARVGLALHDPMDVLAPAASPHVADEPEDEQEEGSRAKCADDGADLFLRETGGGRRDGRVGLSVVRDFVDVCDCIL